MALQDAVGSEPVRLVIWDLDDTFWRGTLTEGGILEHIVAHEDTVRELARRGIVSSICSKNDLDAVRDVLSARGLWDFFVFASIDWNPKGERVRSIVRGTQLRPETVLYIDDSPNNRAEVASAVPGIRVADERAVAMLLKEPSFRGKDDRGMTRLGQYRMMEARARDAVAHGTDHLAFLRSSGIRVEIDHDVETNIDRVVELINRTNQLNFTKLRLPEDPAAARADLRAQLDATSGRRAAIVRARDRFGDHGIVGFWMMDGIWVEPYLIHFTFSCRTLGLGVEQWVYERLGRPRLEIVGEVVSSLESPSDWINAGDGRSSGGASDVDRAAPARVRLRGGCELEVLKHFFSFQCPDVSASFVFPRDGQTVWASHVATLFDQPAAHSPEGAAALDRIGFKSDDLCSDFLAPVDGPTLLVLSPSADAHVPLYRHRTLGIQVPVKLFGIDVSAVPDAASVTRYCEANRLEGTRANAFRRWMDTLHGEWAPVPFADLDLLAAYERLAETVPEDSLLVVILPIAYAEAAGGGSVTFPDQDLANDWMRTVASRQDRVAVVETADCLRSRQELRKMSHLHFARDVYHRLHERIVAVHADWQSARCSTPRFTPRDASSRRRV